MRTFAVLISCLVFTCCTNRCSSSRADLSPEEVVAAYLDVSINMENTDEKSKLLDLTTGGLASALNSADQETMQRAFIDRNYKLVSYSVVERYDRTPRETEISFELSYHDKGNNAAADTDTSPLVTTTNTVSVVREEGVWRISDVLGKRTTIDFFDTGEKITPDNGPSSP